MSDPLIKLVESSTYMIPWVAFMAGLGGSIHCVGMCGGLVSACTKNTGDIASYQFGRLFSYSLLGLFAGLLGQIFLIQQMHPALGLLPALTVGGLLIFWGIQNLRGKKAELPIPNFINKLVQKSYAKTLTGKGGSNKFKAWSVGALSIFLPCGFLYGFVLAAATFQNPWIGLLSMFGFWLGTVPAMSFAPSVFQKFINKFLTSKPVVSSLLLVSIGIGTIGYRTFQFVTTGSCH